MVVMIIAILGAIAATRLSRMTDDPDAQSTAATLVELQKAVDRYHGEHGRYPAAAALESQLTQFTDSEGNVSASRSPVFRFGPYLKKAPPIHPGRAGVALLWRKSLAAAKWVYDEASGEVREN